jgi:hypothetical protein
MKRLLTAVCSLVLVVALSAPRDAKASDIPCDLLLEVTNYFCENDYYPECWYWDEAWEDSECANDPSYDPLSPVISRASGPRDAGSPPPSADVSASERAWS